MNPHDYAQILYETLETKGEHQQSQIFERFRDVLIRNKESYLAPAIARGFTKIQEQKEQEKTVYISSASELTASQKKELENISREPREFSINQDLLGGVAVRQKDRIYNATLRKKMELLKSNI